jgi:glycosyltransferase involved in cell wall biosynthesis
MSDHKPKILIFMLCRTGCIPYATQMVNALRNVDKYVFVSSFSPEALPKDNYKIRTYRNRWEFVLSSFIFLPFLCFRVIALTRKYGYQKAYFPVFHHWNPVLIRISKWLGMEIVFTVHDGILHAGEQRSWEQRLLNYCIHNTDKLIFLSEYVEQLTSSEIGYSARSCIIPHPVLKTKYEVKDHRKLPSLPALLFLGRVVDYKGVDLLFEAVEGLPEDIIGKLTVAGRDYQKGKLSIPQNITVDRINRWLDDEEIGELLNTHDILILPYKEASQSGIVTLGISAAIPMICTRVGGLTEQLTEEEALFVQPTADAIKSAILKLVADHELYRDLHHKLKQKRNSENTNQGNSLRSFLVE